MITSIYEGVHVRTCLRTCMCRRPWSGIPHAVLRRVGRIHSTYVTRTNSCPEETQQQILSTVSRHSSLASLRLVRIAASSGRVIECLCPRADSEEKKQCITTSCGRPQERMRTRISAPLYAQMKQRGGKLSSPH